jgi:hypothetical protein
MFLPGDLDVDVLVVVLVQGCYGAFVAQPEVYGVCGFLEGYAGERDVWGYICEYRDVLVAEIVIFYGIVSVRLVLFNGTILIDARV